MEAGSVCVAKAYPPVGGGWVSVGDGVPTSAGVAETTGTSAVGGTSVAVDGATVAVQVAGKVGRLVGRMIASGSVNGGNGFIALLGLVKMERKMTTAPRMAAIITNDSTFHSRSF
jgi:hypothetical protein